MYFKMER